MTTTHAAPTTITWTPASVADATWDFSANQDNDTAKGDDALVGGFITTGTSPTDGEKITIALAASWDDGTTYTAGVSGSDGGTPDTGEEDNLFILTVIEVDATSDHRYEFGPFSVADACGAMPEHWCIGMKNDSGVALNSTAGNHEAKWTGIAYT